MKILIMGLPGAGKSTLARELSERLKAVHFEANEIRREINKDLGFSVSDRFEQARRMGVLCDIVKRSGNIAIGDFICPLPICQSIFDADFTIFADRVTKDDCIYEDTSRMFIPPVKFDLRVTKEGSVFHWADEAVKLLKQKS